MKSHRKINIAVIGCGVIGPVHMAAYAANKNASLVCVCDLDEARAEAAAGKHGVAKWTTDSSKVFADPEIDAVSICTDHASHARLACAALAAGKHVLCEKPLARCAADLRKMLAAAAAHPDLVAECIFQHRFEPLPKELYKVLHSGLLGTPLTAVGIHNCFRPDSYFAEAPWRGTRAGGGGSILINQSIHFFDQLLWLSDGVKSVRAYRGNLAHKGVIETEDTVSATLTTGSGALATYICTNASDQNWNWSLAFHGTKGDIEIANDRITVCNLVDKKKQAAVEARLAKAQQRSAQLLGKSYYGSGHQAQIDDFVRAVATGAPCGMPFAEAAKTMRAVYAVYAGRGEMNQ